MKKLFTLSFILISFYGYSQPMVVARNPAWVAQDKVREANELKDRIALYAQTSQIVTNAREHLKWVKDATNKLKQINRRIANYRYLEESITAVSEAYNRVQNTLATLNSSSCFTIAEYRTINQSLMNMLGQTTFAISALTIVITDNFSEMNDAERLASLSNALNQLRDDIGVVDNFLNEVEILNNQRQQIKTINALNKIFK